MSKNEGNLDRILRVAAAAVAVVAAVAVGGSSVLGALLLIVAATLLVTSAVGFCPLYRLLGISTDTSAAKISTHV